VLSAARLTAAALAVTGALVKDKQVAGPRVRISGFRRPRLFARLMKNWPFDLMRCHETGLNGKPAQKSRALSSRVSRMHAPETRVLGSKLSGHRPGSPWICGSFAELVAVTMENDLLLKK